MWKLASKMVKNFEAITKEYGGIECRNIARVDWKDPGQVKDFYKDPNSRRQECFKVIEATVTSLEELLEELNKYEEAHK